MTAAVSIFAFSGVTTIRVAGGVDLRYDSVQNHKEPILGRDLLSCTSVAADTSEASAAPAKTECALIQVENGKRVYYEIAPAGHTLLTPGPTSRIMEGSNTITWGEGWRLSVVELV